MNLLPTNIAAIEPMLPEEANRQLDDVAFDLIARANTLAGQIHPIVTRSVGDLVRSMNCYYSNFIEGHDTHPRDIDRALRNDFSNQPKQRELQKEAVAHIEVQRLIDEGRDDRGLRQGRLPAEDEEVLPVGSGGHIRLRVQRSD